MRTVIIVIASILIGGPWYVHASTAKQTKPATPLPRPEYNIHNQKPIGSSELSTYDFSRSIIRETAVAGSQAYTLSGATPPPWSPGLAIGQSGYDYQHNASAGYQVARMQGADVVHFVWTAFNWPLCQVSGDGTCERYVVYNSYTISTNTLNQGFGGAFVGLGVLARASYINLAVDDSNHTHATTHQREDVSLPANPWHLYFPTPAIASHIDTGLDGYESAGCPEVLWPRIAASTDGSRTVHIISHSNVNDCPVDLLWYWRHNGTSWTGPVIVDSTPQIGYVLADDPTSEKLAVVVNVDNYASMNGLNNVAYYESVTNGAGWVTGSEPILKSVITSYSDPAGPQAWLHLTTAYDNSGTLHIVWDEQRFANNSGQAAIKHWNSLRQTVRTVAQGYWPTPYSSGVFNLNLAKMTLGIGGGATTCQGQANEGFLYVVYTRFAGPTAAEQADHSNLGYYNGELYLNASRDAGLTWSPPINLTNSKTPNCYPGGQNFASGLPEYPDSVCRSEHWATIGQIVSDIDIIFISDLDAGGIPQGEGTWQLNPVFYLRLPGTGSDAPYVCPPVVPNLSAFITPQDTCGYLVSPGTIRDDLRLCIANLGPATLTGSASVTSGGLWLSLVNGGAFAIAPADTQITVVVTMTATALTEGMYEGSIQISHNDTSQPNPLEFPIVIQVGDELHCDHQVDLRTGVGSAGEMQLHLENTGRFAAQLGKGGMWKQLGHSRSIHDASVVIAYGSQNPDTVVYHHFLAALGDPGQLGFDPTSDWVIDTSAYGTGQGFAQATSTMRTIDGMVDVRTDWYFPQDIDSSGFIIVKHTLTNATAVPISNLVVGEWIEFDVIPAQDWNNCQSGDDNEHGFVPEWNLAYQRGYSPPGCAFPSYPGFAPKTSAGITFISGPSLQGPGDPSIRATIRSNSDYTEAVGPSSGFMYSTLTGPAGYTFHQDSTPINRDLYTVMTLEQGRSLAPSDTLQYIFALVSDEWSNPGTATPPDSTGLVRSARKAWFWASGHGVACNCPCYGDPGCDGAVDVVDVVAVINRAFRGFNPSIDPACPFGLPDIDGTTDVNCSGATDVVDVVKTVDVAFRGVPEASAFCKPCAM